MQTVVPWNATDEHMQSRYPDGLAIYRTAYAAMRNPLQSSVRLARPVTFLWIPAVTAAVAMLPTTASAHVKWFEPYDVSAPPASVAAVMTRPFVLALVGFTVLLVASFVLDRLAADKVRFLTAPIGREYLQENLLRAGTGAFFMALFAGGGVILTPELHTDATWPAWLQLGIAVSMLSSRTCLLGAVGIVVLYELGVEQYGVFHLFDYPMFLGLAAYLGLTSFASERLRAHRMLVLHVSICIALMWGAVEKWSYPQWTFPLLAERPYLAFGLTPEHFMVFAGFVEFTFAFYILTGLGLLRLAILGLGTIFTAAILDFGKIDAIGHMPILVSMAAMFLHGPTALQRWLHAGSDSTLRRSRTFGVAFATTVFAFLAIYSGLQSAEYGPQHRPDAAVSASHHLAEAPTMRRHTGG